MASLQQDFQAHEAGIGSRVAKRHLRVSARMKWYGEQVARDIRIPLAGRVKLAAELLRGKVVANISRPVYKYQKELTRGPRKGQTVTVTYPESRSKPGEFPRAETSTLLRNIEWQMASNDPAKPISQVLVPEQIQRQGNTQAKLKTTLDYALILETRLDRSFLKRTFEESLPVLQNVITGRPIT